MPAVTDALPPEPPLSDAEREVCKSYGGWTNFTQSMGLKPWDEDDAAEGKAILAAFASDNHKTANETNNTNGGTGGKN